MAFMVNIKQPSFFYKFISFGRKDILENGLIRFAPLGSFNDPFELEPGVTPLSRVFLEYISGFTELEAQRIVLNSEDYLFSAERADNVECYKAKYRSKIKEYGVLSLSSNDKINQLLSVSMPDTNDPRANLLMWSHYANSHKGFVIEFRSDFIEGVRLEKVEYCTTRDCLTFEDIDDGSFDRVFYKKSPEWCYEQEYRVVLPLIQASKVSEINGEEFHLFKINKGSINSITFGCAMGDAEKDIIRSHIRNDSELRHVVLQHAQLDDREFLLTFYSEMAGWTNNPMYGARLVPGQKKM
ncbi:hypothetical protein BKM17_23720 [Pseudomonas syringae group genomosp. 3]|nr:hypothetical protein BKM17_23720 [Pseudomonas syringae group genomosp. 3]